MKYLFLLLLLLSPPFGRKTWQICILAQRGEAYTRTHWQPWVECLNGQFPEEWFEFVPLGLGEANSWAELDLLLANQAQFFYLSRQNVRWLAILNSPHLADGGSVGSSTWMRADRPYQRLAVLKGKTRSSVDSTLFLLA
ncbi:substrate-binding domain-containing protein [Mannheimia granulomatis]|uniref:hypothetical protein n=1 Tax=Mannheimia granulomatis TaxID=85402 RepID=UPI00047B921A|nr:hypothetical protein [Mannheimia granulomatis]QLB19065.1 hypothetical protein A6B41_06215 [Mannheimia granulomatis]